MPDNMRRDVLSETLLQLDKMTIPATPPRRPSRTSASPRQQQQDEHSVGVSSVLVGSPLTRELSDLSGSYAGNGSRNGNIPRHVSDPTEVYLDRPWRQAHCMSPPPHRQLQQQSTMMKATIVVERSGACEVVEHDIPYSPEPHCRLPLILLLMDPARKQYELMQLWVDSCTDSVRDVLHSVQKKLADGWRQDYDGLFQIRGSKFSQLIHILNVAKYEVQPREVWVAKPWSMSARATVLHAGSVLRHLKSIGVLCSLTEERKTTSRLKTEETVWGLSSEAVSRIHCGDVLNHHHAHQYLTFAPSFEPEPMEVTCGPGDDASQLSEPSCTHIHPRPPSRQKKKPPRTVVGRKHLNRQMDVELSFDWDTPPTGRTTITRSTKEPTTKQKRRRFWSLLSSLNCSRKSMEIRPKISGDPTMDDWIWEAEKTVEEQSVVSESAPLLNQRASDMSVSTRPTKQRVL